MMREVNRYFEPFWRRRFDNNLVPICIPYDFPTMETAMRVIEILSIRKQFSKASPLVVELGKGEHEITSYCYPPGISGNSEHTLDVTCNNITFVGQGTGETTILGGIGIYNKKNITLKSMSLTHQTGSGISLYGAKVELVNVKVFDCENCGVFVGSLGMHRTNQSKLVAKQCEISNNGTGLYIHHKNSKSSLTDCINITFFVLYFTYCVTTLFFYYIFCVVLQSRSTRRWKNARRSRN